MIPLAVLIGAAIYLSHRRHKVLLGDPPKYGELELPVPQPVRVPPVVVRPTPITYLPMLPPPEIAGGLPAAEIVEIPEYIPPSPERQKQVAQLQAMLLAQQQAELVKSQVSSYRPTLPVPETVDPGELARRQRVAAAKAEQAKKLAQMSSRMQQMEYQLEHNIPTPPPPSPKPGSQWWMVGTTPRPYIDVIPQSPAGLGYRVIKSQIIPMIRKQMEQLSVFLNDDELEKLVQAASGDIESLLDEGYASGQIEVEVRDRTVARVKQLMLNRASDYFGGVSAAAMAAGGYAAKQFEAAKELASQAASDVAEVGKKAVDKAVDKGVNYARKEAKIRVLEGLKMDERLKDLPDDFLEKLADVGAEVALKHFGKPEGKIAFYVEKAVEAEARKHAPEIANLKTVKKLRAKRIPGISEQDIRELGKLAEDTAREVQATQPNDLDRIVALRVGSETLNRVITKMIGGEKFFGKKLSGSEVRDALANSDLMIKKFESTEGGSRWTEWGGTVNDKDPEFENNSAQVLLRIKVASLAIPQLDNIVDESLPFLDSSDRDAIRRAFVLGVQQNVKLPKGGVVTGLNDILPPNNLQSLANTVIGTTMNAINKHAEENDLTIPDVVNAAEEIKRFFPNDPRAADVANLVSRFSEIPESDEESRRNLNQIIRSYTSGGQVVIPPGMLSPQAGGPVTPITPVPEPAPGQYVELEASTLPMEPVTPPGRSMYEIQRHTYAQDEADQVSDYDERATGYFKKNKDGTVSFKRSSSGIWHGEIARQEHAKEYEKAAAHFDKMMEKKRSRGEVVPLRPGERSPIGAETIAFAFKKKIDEAKIGGDISRYKTVWGTGETSWAADAIYRMLAPRIKMLMELSKGLPQGTMLRELKKFIKDSAISNVPSIFGPIINAMHQYQQTPVTGETVMEVQANLPDQAEAQRRMLLVQETWNAFIDHLARVVAPAAIAELKPAEVLKMIAQKSVGPEEAIPRYGVEGFDAIAAMEFGSRRQRRRS